MTNSLAQRWRDDLEAWAIPPEILEQADEPPWGHPVAMFEAPDVIVDSPSHQRARSALPPGGSVLDVGCGGGRASLALVPNVGHVTGVDSQAAMLASFASSCERRGIGHDVVLGSWPDVVVPVADVVVCHHLLFNIPDIVPSLLALNAHARHRVVIEVPQLHPLSTWNPLWERFWGLSRPTRPQARDIVAIAAELGLAPQSLSWVDESWGARVALPEEERARYARIRLCLPANREAEVRQAMAAQDGPREMLTIWWDRPAEA